MTDCTMVRREISPFLFDSFKTTEPVLWMLMSGDTLKDSATVARNKDRNKYFILTRLVLKNAYYCSHSEFVSTTASIVNNHQDLLRTVVCIVLGEDITKASTIPGARTY
mmetsp:Transcript_4973/g.11049  ORF Transcript_4973/g.11049 Transcript_4973/m.11049 type:complete len:109 (+) Transcript_4973:848-1174(+)